MSSLEINYCKHKLLDVSNLDKEYQLTNLQNYCPTYSLFFEMNENNYNTISLNQKYNMLNLSQVTDKESNVLEKAVFVKFSPLLDPMRYMIGKYDLSDTRLLALPDYKLDESNSHSKLISANNASYTDNFFSYLTSSLLNKHNFTNGIDYYGSYLGIQSKYKMNVTDDLEYLNSSSFFLSNLNTLFTIDAHAEMMCDGSRGRKYKLNISDTLHNISVVDLDALDASCAASCDASCAASGAASGDASVSPDADDATETFLIEHMNKSVSTHSDSSDSNVSYSSDEIEDTEDDEESCSDESEESGSDESEEECFTYINNFPVQMICLEKCDGTLDDLFVKETVDIDSGRSALFQIIMALITYQKAFHFTHNDLHTNNVMYINTDQEFIYYLYNNKYYKVPTFGKIFKIIDYGRSIYKFQGKQFCSDSFAKGGDASTQYNCEPFMNENKPRIDPNYSFDLCRLGCSIYDFIIDDESGKLDDLQQTVKRWCMDDNNKNVLYKKTGEERYPQFKLYKMIARTVNRHTPQAQLEFEYFNQYECLAVDGAIDIDSIPCYV